MNSLIENLLIKYLSPLLNKTGTGWKTLIGLLLLVMSWVYQTWIDPESEMGYWIQHLALVLTGIGVYHKALKTEAIK